MYDSPESLVVVTENPNRHLPPSPPPPTVAAAAVRSKADRVSISVGLLFAVALMVCGGLSLAWLCRICILSNNYCASISLMK